MKLQDIENDYIDAYKSQWECLENVFDISKNSVSIDFDSTDITLCLIQRLNAYYQTQNNIKGFLNKRYAAPAADFFVESVLYFLKLSLEVSKSNLEAHSERQIKRKRNAIRPDISIWKNDEVVSIIECKTQLGWSRTTWQRDFEKREGKLKSDFPEAEAYLLVMTGSNWGGFSEEHFCSGKYYCLLKDKWPTEIDINSTFNDIFTPIENLFKLIIKKG